MNKRQDKTYHRWFLKLRNPLNTSPGSNLAWWRLSIITTHGASRLRRTRLAIAQEHSKLKMCLLAFALLGYLQQILSEIFPRVLFHTEGRDGSVCHSASVPTNNFRSERSFSDDFHTEYRTTKCWAIFLARNDFPVPVGSADQQAFMLGYGRDVSRKQWFWQEGLEGDCVHGLIAAT